KTVVEVTFTPIVDQIERALEEVLKRVISLPGAKPILERLKWTFYRGPEPMYAEDENDSDEAGARLASWAAFASQQFAFPFADKLRAIARDIHLEEADVEALLTPRLSFFDVIESTPDTLRVRDRLSNDVLTVRRRRQDPDISEGELIVGALHNTGRGDY